MLASTGTLNFDDRTMRGCVILLPESCLRFVTATEAEIPGMCEVMARGAMF